MEGRVQENGEGPPDPFFRPVNRLRFADTLAWLRHGNLSDWPDLKVNPLRPGRLEPRCLKGGRQRFPYMMIPRAQLKSQLRAK